MWCNDGQFAKFCQVAGRPDLAQDARYARNRDRVLHRASLVPELEPVMKTRAKADWLAALEAAQVPCGAINKLDEVFADPQVQARAMVDHWAHPIKADLRLVASPIKLSQTPVRHDHPPPLLGQHTDQVLGELLGWDAARIAALREQGII